MTDAFLTEADYCDYDTVVELEKLGMPGHSSGTVCCSLYKAQKWLRLQGYNIDVRYNYIGKYYFVTVCNNDWIDGVENVITHNNVFNSYESALFAGIKKIIEHYK